MAKLPLSDSINNLETTSYGSEIDKTLGSDNSLEDSSVSGSDIVIHKLRRFQPLPLCSSSSNEDIVESTNTLGP